MKYSIFFAALLFPIAIFAGIHGNNDYTISFVNNSKQDYIIYKNTFNNKDHFILKASGSNTNHFYYDFIVPTTTSEYVYRHVYIAYAKNTGYNCVFKIKFWNPSWSSQKKPWAKIYSEGNIFPNCSLNSDAITIQSTTTGKRTAKVVFTINYMLFPQRHHKPNSSE